MANFLFIIVAIAIVGLSVLCWWYNSPAYKGKKGENRVHNILLQLPDEYVILVDVVLRADRGTTQIDHVVVSRYGVFAIETKNYRGEIYGDDSRQEWTQLIVTEVTYVKKWWKSYTYVTKNHFYNPVKQSLGHAFRIKELLTAFPHVKIVSIVVFAGDAVLSNVDSRHHVVYEENLLDIIGEYRTICLTDDDVQKVIDIIEKNNIREFVNDRQHVKNIRTAAREVNATINAGICPKCGGNLVKRTGRYGSFYGCSNYSKCRFTAK